MVCVVLTVAWRVVSTTLIFVSVLSSHACLYNPPKFHVFLLCPPISVDEVLLFTWAQLANKSCLVGGTPTKNVLLFFSSNLQLALQLALQRSWPLPPPAAAVPALAAARLVKQRPRSGPRCHPESRSSRIHGRRPHPHSQPRPSPRWPHSHSHGHNRGHLYGHGHRGIGHE